MPSQHCGFSLYLANFAAAVLIAGCGSTPTSPTLAPTIGTFAASPSTITAGQATALSWAGIENASSCDLSGIGAVACTGGSVTVTPSATATYTLAATGSGGTTRATATVTVAALSAAIGSFAATPSAIRPGQSSVLAWSGITNAASCSIDNGVGAFPCVNGSASVSPSATTTYTLTASGAGGSVTSTATVTVTTAPIIGSFWADPSAISAGQITHLSWRGIANATQCEVDHGVGTVACSDGSVAVSPAVTTEYTLRVTGPGGAETSRAAITVGAPRPTIGSFTATPSEVPLGDPVVIAWSDIHNASRCVLEPFNQEVPCSGGTRSITPAEPLAITMQMTWAGGIEIVTIFVTVRYPLPVIRSFTANPAAITRGQTSLLTWQLSGEVATCAIDQGIGAVDCASAGGVLVSPSATTTYTFTVTNRGGTTSLPATVTVASGGSRTFEFTGMVQSFVVPAGVTEVRIEARGAQGGAGPNRSPGAINAGGFAAGTFDVTPGETLLVYVGGQGGVVTTGGTGAAGGFNGGASGGSCSAGGGGGGGGASDVRRGGAGLADRIVVAGGGGGSAGVTFGRSDMSDGGAGGGLSGSAGQDVLRGTGGSGGTQTAGGSGGNTGANLGPSGVSGSSGSGGTGGGNGCVDGGGGGGGGYYGGGGGEGANFNVQSIPAAGGGGGSGFVAPGARTAIVQSGGQTGHGIIVITWR